MVLNLYLAVGIFTIHISLSFCFLGYDQFPGFDDTNGYDSTQYVSRASEHETTDISQNSQYMLRTSTRITPKKNTKSIRIRPVTATTDSASTTRLVLPITYPKFNCSEDERPFNIGSYEVPTQKDLVLQIQKTLKRLFSLYREKALNLLQDIQEATRATSFIEKKCRQDRNNRKRNYKSCVKEVSKKCEYITKSLVTTLEMQRADVSAFIEGTICNVTEMRADPLQLIKTLAMELATLEFALPGFLRLLGSCSEYCNETFPKVVHKKPPRRMTDQDLVVKHFLTKKTYVQLINPETEKDPK